RLELSHAERIGALRGYFETHGCPEGIICLHDEIMILVYRALRDCGYKIPEDVLLVGCDGIPLIECFDPPLSAIRHPLEEATKLAWQFLRTRIESPHIPLQQTTRKAKLVMRESMQP
ncbi:MAG: LacI family transcriptional regulator, partial [Cytophagaceae bacterium]